MALRPTIAANSLAMSESTQKRIDRVRSWLDRMRQVTDATHPLGRAARRQLPSATGLSEASVEWALTHAFETDATDAEIRTLVDSVSEAPATHVLLSANVFVGALRAIALALAGSETVRVRPSRRESVTTELLLRAAPSAFDLVSELRPNPGDHVWAYGADATISRLKTDLPCGVVLHGHANGFGVFVVDTPSRLVPSDFDAMAVDIAAFDQRGCLSPRFVLLEGDRATGMRFADRLLAALTRVATLLPVGRVDPMTLNETARHRELWRYLGDVYQGRGGMVTLDADGNSWGEPPTCRAIHVRATKDALADLAGHTDAITAIGSSTDPGLVGKILTYAPRVRWSPFGYMQRPRLDGPVDRRVDPRGIVL
jgi:hypothetical protein